MRNAFEDNETNDFPPELVPYETFRYALLPKIREDLEYKLIPISDGRWAVVIDRK